MLPLMLCFSTLTLNPCLVIPGGRAEGKIKLLALSGKKDTIVALFLAGAYRILFVGG